jgi:hypothetical protein
VNSLPEADTLWEGQDSELWTSSCGARSRHPETEAGDYHSPGTLSQTGNYRARSRHPETRTRDYETPNRPSEVGTSNYGSRSRHSGAGKGNSRIQTDIQKQRQESVVLSAEAQNQVQATTDSQQIFASRDRQLQVALEPLILICNVLEEKDGFTLAEIGARNCHCPHS